MRVLRGGGLTPFMIMFTEGLKVPHLWGLKYLKNVFLWGGEDLVEI